MPAIIWNLEQVDATEAECAALAEAGVIYDPHAGDPHSETAEGAIFYPEDDTRADPLDHVEAALKRLRTHKEDTA